MDIKSLMIGDWVSYHGIVNKVAPADFDFYHKKWIDEIEPVPLTPEILEKNGFKKFNFRGIDGQHEWAWWNNTSTNVSLWCRELNDNTKDGWMIKIESPTSSLCVKVVFLHELQHALKLCWVDKEIEL